MTLWLGIVIGAVAVYSWKLLGHILPKQLLDHPRVAASANYLTIALMAALVGVQAFITKAQFVLDARLAAVALAILLSALRAPFLVIVAAAAALAAVLRIFF